MFDLIYDRSFRRNKKLLNDLGLHYTQAQHKVYRGKLMAQQIEPLSVKGLVLDKKLDQPVDLENCSYYTRWGNASVNIATLTNCEQRNRQQAEEYTRNNESIVKKAVMALSEAVGLPLAITSESEMRQVTIKEITLMNPHKDLAYACDQKWKVNWVGTNRRAQVN